MAIWRFGIEPVCAYYLLENMVDAEYHNKGFKINGMCSPRFVIYMIRSAHKDPWVDAFSAREMFQSTPR